MITALASGAEISAARELIERNGLTFEESFDDLFGCYEPDGLAAVGARSGNVLKMLAVDAAYQGGALLGEIVTVLVQRGLDAGFESLFIFTKPEHVPTFQAMNFALLANQGEAALLEYGAGLPRWLAGHQLLVKPGVNGAVVMNCNPFTLGHRYLVETAARRVDTLYLFVVREDRSTFPFDLRFRLVREGVRDIGNVVMLDTGQYAVSQVTFPTYFLKQDAPAARIQMELDLILFASRIAPFFGISRRFAGTEPNCRLTESYNEAMKLILPQYGVAMIEIERKQAGDSAISASRVRALLAENDYEAIRGLVPETTLAALREDTALYSRRSIFSRSATR